MLDADARKNEIEEKLDKALVRCLDQAAAATPDSSKAVHFSQAAQNLSHVKINLATLTSKPSTKKD